MHGYANASKANQTIGTKQNNLFYGMSDIVEPKPEYQFASKKACEKLRQVFETALQARGAPQIDINDDKQLIPCFKVEWTWFLSGWGERGKNIIETGELPKGFPTHTKDVNGQIICLGDIVDYDFKGDTPCPFEVVFEENAFRKKYEKLFEKDVQKPELRFSFVHGINLRYKVVKKWNENNNNIKE